MKTVPPIIAALCILASTSIAFPVGNTLGPAQNVLGQSTCHPTQNFRFTVAFDSLLGGHWNLTGHTHLNTDGTYTDSFRGTVSDTSIQDTFTRNDFDWVSDSWFLCRHTQIICSSF